MVAQVAAQLIDSVKFACQLREFVIGLGQFALLDRLDGHGHLRVLAGVFAGGQLGGELLGLVDGQADDRVVEAFDQPAGANLMRQALRGGARNLFAVDRRRQVDRDKVALGGRTIHSGQGAEPSPQRLQLGVDVVVADRDRIHRHLQPTEVREGDLGADIDLGGEGEVRAVLLLGHLDFGPADRMHLGLGDRLSIPGGQRLVDDLVEHLLAAETRLQQLHRHLAGPEPG